MPSFISEINSMIRFCIVFAGFSNLCTFALLKINSIVYTH